MGKHTLSDSEVWVASPDTDARRTSPVVARRIPLRSRGNILRPQPDPSRRLFRKVKSEVDCFLGKMRYAQTASDSLSVQKPFVLTSLTDRFSLGLGAFRSSQKGFGCGPDPMENYSCPLSSSSVEEYLSAPGTTPTRKVGVTSSPSLGNCSCSSPRIGGGGVFVKI